VTCTQPGCGGTIQDGYCDTCGLAATAGASGASSASSGPSASSASGTQGTRSRSRSLGRTYRALARLTPDEDRRIELVDMGNAIRPRTLT